MNRFIEAFWGTVFAIFICSVFALLIYSLVQEYNYRTTHETVQIEEWINVTEHPVDYPDTYFIKCQPSVYINDGLSREGHHVITGCGPAHWAYISSEGPDNRCEGVGKMCLIIHNETRLKE